MMRNIFVLIIIAIGGINSLRGSFYALLFYLWIAYFRPESWIWNSSLKSFSLSLIVGVYLIASFLIRGERLKINGRIVLMALMLLHTLGATLLSDHQSFCWPYWIDFAKVIIVTYILALLTNTPKRLKLAVLVITLSLSFESAKQGWAGLLLHPGVINRNEIEFLGDNNCVAVGMLMLVPLLLALEAPRKWIGAGYRFLAIGVAYRALSTYSRGGLLSFITMCTLLWAKSQHRIRTLIIIGALAGIILPIFPQKFWQRMSTITASQEDMDPSAAGRVYFWSVGLKMALDHPFFGVGLNGYRLSYDKYDTKKAYGEVRSVHSMWFGILSESGFVGMFLFLTIFVQSFRSCARARKICGDNESGAFVKKCATAIQTSLITAAIGGAFLPFQYVEMLWHFFGLSIAVEQIAMAPVAVSDELVDPQPSISEAIPAAATLTNNV
jgi:putative inorganic carbon (hco3(-)) transporter